MGLLNGEAIGEGDFITTSAGAGDSGKAPKLNASGKLDPSFFTIETTAGATHSLTTVAGQRVIVWAKGHDSRTAGSPSAINLKYNSVTKDTVSAGSTSGSTQHVPFSLMYSEIPGAGTQNITVDGGTSLGSVVIMVLKIG
jgi:hypothetical protein